jgi:bifunctional ADP-heptose synthase (sugar kinase/adenylyltransferase)
VLIFDDVDPGRVIRAIRPDVLVKGGDWPTEQIVGADFVRSTGGTVRSLPYIEGASTSAIIRRLTSSGSLPPSSVSRQQTGTGDRGPGIGGRG